MSKQKLPDMSAQERATLITWLLASDEALTTERIAKLCNLSYQGAWAMMQHISRGAPICFVDHKWQRMKK